MFDHAEGTLTYSCPDTGRAVLTGITTDKTTLRRLDRFKLSVWCPHCASPHMIEAKDASISWQPRREYPRPILGKVSAVAMPART